MPRPCADNLSYTGVDPNAQSQSRKMPILASSRGGHHHLHTSYHEGHSHRAYHPYARTTRNETVASPFFGDPSRRPYSYEYYRPYEMPINNFPMYHHAHQTNRPGNSDAIGTSPKSRTEVKSWGGPSHQGVHAEETKRPPRPYTEYNIFFQLERERILGELEEKQRNKQCEDKLSTQTDTCDLECKSAVVNGVDTNDKQNQMDDGVLNSDARDTGVDDSQKVNRVSYIDEVLNVPSDSNDILPRPTQFQHLKLAPLWYDSTHRLALSKENKSRRRHRKTHGLVGFLDLTKRISKAWAEADIATKEYCKRVADRQLQMYKEELKTWKNRQPSSAEDGGDDDDEVDGNQNDSTLAENLDEKARQQNETKALDIDGMNGSRSHTQTAAPPTPTPSHPLAIPCTVPSVQQSVHQRYNEYWQHQQGLYHQQRAHLHSIHLHRHYPLQTSKSNHGPVIPQITPESHQDQQKTSHHEGVRRIIHTPLDELMHRRKLYGSQITTDKDSQKFRSPGTSRQERVSSKGRKYNDGNNVKKISKQVRNKSKDSKGTEKTYLSPSEMLDKTHSSTVAITPSPSRRRAASKPKAKVRTSSKEDLSVGVNANGQEITLTPGSILPPENNGSFYPSSTSPGSLIMCAISPSCMMTPGISPAFDGQPNDNSRSYLHGEFVENEMNSSPLPYIDWDSPLNRSPLSARENNSLSESLFQQLSQKTQHQSLPSHLALPVVNSASHRTSGQRGYGDQYFGQSPVSSRCNKAMLPPPSPCPIVDGNVGELDLDDEEMQLLWRRLTAHNSQKRNQQRDAASAWIYDHHVHAGSFSTCSPGGSSAAMDSCVVGNFAMAHSFSSPVERYDTRQTHRLFTTDDECSGHVKSNTMSKGSNYSTKNIPSLQDAI